MTSEGYVQPTFLQTHLDAFSLLQKIQHIERLASLTRDLAVELSWSLDRDSPPAVQTLVPLRADAISLPAGISERDALRERIGKLNDLSQEVNGTLRDLLAALDRRVKHHEVLSDGALPAANFREVLDAFERQLIVSALRACSMKQAAAANLLGILPTTLSEKLKRLGLRTPKHPRHEAD